ncbi:amidohydrolase family protein [Pedobacter agri]|uniref:amidohydrolase family protein n=1 Tax=Pedobacter agri TaxID=454586 RepID=UPI0027D770A1|nr:amidohydrolase family protein [Pedobacter agri]
MKKYRINTPLNLSEKLDKELGKKDRRLKIEHAQHILPSDIPRFKTQNIIASVQPHHAIDDGKWAGKVIGHEPAKTTYAFRSLLNTGTKLAFGSDGFVAPANPLIGIYAAVYVILEKDITKLDPVLIESVKILSTVVGGKQVFKLEKKK